MHCIWDMVFDKHTDLRIPCSQLQRHKYVSGSEYAIEYLAKSPRNAKAAMHLWKRDSHPQKQISIEERRT